MPDRGGKSCCCTLLNPETPAGVDDTACLRICTLLLICCMTATCCMAVCCCCKAWLQLALAASCSNHTHLQVLVQIVSDDQVMSHTDSVGLHGMRGTIIEVSQRRIIKV